MTDHLAALELRLSHERVRLANAKSAVEREMRAVWIAQIEKEITGERAFLARKAETEADSADDMTADELLAALTAE